MYKLARVIIGLPCLRIVIMFSLTLIKLYACLGVTKNARNLEVIRSEGPTWHSATKSKIRIWNLAVFNSRAKGTLRYEFRFSNFWR